MWSETDSKVTPGLVALKRSEMESRYGVTFTLVDGDDYLSLKDNAIALIYDGGFSSSREAAQWCKNHGTSGGSCLGVGLNDVVPPATFGGAYGRVYVRDL